MSQPRHEPMTPEEFLAWEARQELKWEFDGFQPVAMTGGTFGHSRIQGNLVAALIARLRGRPCQPCGPDVRVPIPGGRYRYPDALVVCRPVRPDAVEVPDPVVLFEVLSGGTAHTDRVVKLREYRSVPSVRRYVMLEQDEALATVVARTETGWSIDQVDAAGTLALPEIGVEIPLAELYEGIGFEAGSAQG